MNSNSSISSYVIFMFSLDLRSLAIMRIILGCAILRDLSIIVSTLSGLLGDQSVLPPSVALSNFFEQNYRSFHIISGQLRRQVLLITTHIALALAFLLGRKTKYVTPLLRACTCSLQGANPIITNGGDTVVRLILLRSIFLPIAQTRSIDSYQKNPPTSYSVSSLASIGYMLQVLHVYMRNYFLKTDPIRRSEYTATYYALSLDAFAKDFGLRIYQFPKLMKIMTRGRIHLEFPGILFYLVPIPWIRVIVVLSFIIAHLMMNATLYIGAFPRYAIAAWMGMMPSVFRDLGIIHQYTTKISNLFSQLYHTLHQIFVKIPGFASQSKDYIKNTTRFPLGVSVLLFCIIIYSFLRNLRSINFDKRDDYFPTSINRFGFLLRIDQYRAMFSPYPKIDDGWYNITGITEFKGERINISNPDRPPFDNKPSHTEIAYLMPHEKFRKLIDNLRQKSNSQYRQYFTAYLCRTHNATATKYTRVKSINLTYMQENTKLDYKTDPVVPVDLGTWDCAEQK